MRPLHRLEPAQLNNTWFGATEEKSLGGKLINKDCKLKKEICLSGRKKTFLNPRCMSRVFVVRLMWQHKLLLSS